MTVLDRLQALDRRWVFLLMGIAVSIPFVFRIGVGIIPSPEVISFHDAIEQIPEGAAVYLAADLDPGSQAELLPMLEDLGDWFGEEIAARYAGTRCNEIVGDRVGTDDGKQICGSIIFQTFGKVNEILAENGFH